MMANTSAIGFREGKEATGATKVLVQAVAVVQVSVCWVDLLVM